MPAMFKLIFIHTNTGYLRQELSIQRGSLILRNYIKVSVEGNGNYEISHLRSGDRSTWSSSKYQLKLTLMSSYDSLIEQARVFIASFAAC